ncbi:MAG: Nif3-like dinuclear metal center hexameric protein [Chitinophagales bacterium]
MKLKDIIKTLETFAPPTYQESYDNAGLITGNKDWEFKGAVLCLDAIEAVIDEAIGKKCNLVIAHHPIVFVGLKKLTGSNYIERVIIKAIKNDIAIYAIHTNLDNVASGVNAMICNKLGLKNTRILSPMKNPLKKLITFCPEEAVEEVRQALSEAGAGVIGHYSECSYNVKGFGTFKGDEKTNPAVGKKNQLEKVEEIKLEMIFPAAVKSKVINALINTHPYEEVAYDIIALENSDASLGAGMIGDLPEAIPVELFLKQLKKKMNCKVIRHTEPVKASVKKIALCGGAGSFLLNNAIGKNADVFITGDFKYHQFFDADGKILIADIGHYESEQFTPQLLIEILGEKFSNFALHLSEVNTNPIKYYY